jgi:hypothetical protein
MLESHDEEMDLDIDGQELEVEQCPVDIPISIDTMYNLIVCKDCGIGLPFEWVPTHLQEHHAIGVTSEQGWKSVGSTPGILVWWNR